MPVAELKPQYVATSSSSSGNDASCAAHPKCKKLVGDCCPTKDGATLDCCKDDNTPPASNFVFLQKFPLGGVNLFYHTEVLVCPRDGFSKEDQSTLDNKIAAMTNFAQIDDSWWTSRTANCVELGYGGAPCSKECC